MDLNPQPRRFADRSRPALEITITGLRPGEKLHEVLLGAGEADSRPVHPLISHVAVPTLDPWVLQLAPLGCAVELLPWLSQACLTAPSLRNPLSGRSAGHPRCPARCPARCSAFPRQRVP